METSGPKVAAYGQQSVNDDPTFLWISFESRGNRKILALIANRKIVDQPRFSDPCGRQDPRGLPKSVQALETIGIGERDIVDAVEAPPNDHRLGPGERFADIGAAR